MPRFFDNFFPAALLALVPIDLILGFVKGIYPTQASLAVWLGGVLSLQLLLRLSRPRHVQASHSEDPEAVANALLNRQLNFGLGVTLLGLALFLVYFAIVMIMALPAHPLPFDKLTPAKWVEMGFILLFNLMALGLEAFAARIYLMGRGKL